jgi:pyrroloquinoline quinone biosynthesis protein D
LSTRAVPDASSHPRLAAHRKLIFDAARKSWTIQAPERVFLLDEIAHAIVSRCDGGKSVAAIVDELCSAYDAPRDAVVADVLKLVRDFHDKGVMVL